MLTRRKHYSCLALKSACIAVTKWLTITLGMALAISAGQIQALNLTWVLVDDNTVCLHSAIVKIQLVFMLPVGGSPVLEAAIVLRPGSSLHQSAGCKQAHIAECQSPPELPATHDAANCRCSCWLSQYHMPNFPSACDRAIGMHCKMEVAVERNHMQSAT